MTTLFGNLELRPTRIGFLVDPEDMASIRLAMQICSSLWGGKYNPIIPACSTIPKHWQSPYGTDVSTIALTKGYVRFFEPDVIVESTEGLAEQFGIKSFKLEFGQKSVASIDSFLRVSKELQSDTPFGLSVFSLYKQLYEREYKFTTRHGHHVGLFSSFAPKDGPFLDATCGAFPQSGPLSNLTRDYKDAFAPEELKGDGKSWLKAWKEGARFPLQFTSHGLERDLTGGGRDEPILFVVDPQSSLDLVDLWNLRLFQRYVIPINLRWVKDLGPFIKRLIRDNYRPIPGNPYGTMISTTVEFGRSISKDAAEAFIARTKLKDLAPGSWSYKAWYEPIWTQRHNDDLVFHPKRARIKADAKHLELTAVSDERKYSTVRFDSLAPEFAPKYHHNPFGWANILRLNNYGPDSTLALNLPGDYDPETTDYLRGGGAIIPSREGFVLPQSYKEQNEYLRIMTGQTAFSSWMKQHGVESRVSESGRITEQVIRSVSDNSWGTKLIAHEPTLKLLNKMAMSRRTGIDGTVEEFPGSTASAAEWTSLIARRRNDLRSKQITLDHFIKASILKLGLGIECSECTYSNWYAIGEIKEMVICDRCRREFPFPQGNISVANTPWRYRVIGPFSTPYFADGAYATALALRVFSDTLSTGRASLTYATGLLLKTGIEPEFDVDFSLWYQRDSIVGGEQETVAVFGEAKSFGTKCFHIEDIDRMKKVATLFPGAFLVFATLKEALHIDEIAMIAEFARWGREPLDDGRPRAPVIVLTGVEMFTPWHISETWKGLDGKHKEFASQGYLQLENLWTLADITQQIYLELPSRDEELRAIWQAKSDAVKKKSATKESSTKKPAAKKSATKKSATKK
jgi:hypothetical protein